MIRLVENLGASLITTGDWNSSGIIGSCMDGTVLYGLWLLLCDMEGLSLVRRRGKRAGDSQSPRSGRKRLVSSRGLTMRCLFRLFTFTSFLDGVSGGVTTIALSRFAGVWKSQCAPLLLPLVFSLLSIGIIVVIWRCRSVNDVLMGVFVFCPMEWLVWDCEKSEKGPEIRFVHDSMHDRMVSPARQPLRTYLVLWSSRRSKFLEEIAQCCWLAY